jgi:hypothetical protein
MSAPDPTALVKKPLGWAKASPWVFAFLIFVLLILAVRFRNTIAGWFSAMAKWPVVGRPIAWLAGVDGTDKAPPAAAP